MGRAVGTLAPLTGRGREDLRALVDYHVEDLASGSSRRSALEMFQGSAPHPGVFLVDCLVIVGAVRAAGGTTASAIAAAATFVISGLVTNLYSHRTTVDAQGLRWYLRLLPYPLLASAASLVVVGQNGLSVTGPIALIGLALVSLRGLAWMIVANRRRRRKGLTGTLLIGAPARTNAIARRIDAFPEAGLTVAAFYSPTNTNGERTRAHRLLQSGAVGHIVVAADAHDVATLEQCRAWAGDHPVEFHIALPVGAAAGAHIGDLGVVPLWRARTPKQPSRPKRAVDIVVSAFLLLLLAPVLLLAAAAILVYDGRPVIYKQRRVGLGSREFTIWKFRSMVPGADRLAERYADDNVASGLLFKLSEDPRVTPVGGLIRRLSIDELPQLINVLKGDMSLVGPRPLPVDPDEFDPIAARRHQVKPGITGPWQVAGGHALGYEDMIKLDLAYVDTWSLRKDLWYLALTLPTVLVRRSAY